MNQYEAMFVFDPTFGASYEACEGEVRRLMDRAKAEVILCVKWDERRLAYRIKGRKRGVYVLVYFKAEADKISPMHRDAQISESILRLLVLRADGVTPEMMERAAKLRSEPRDDQDEDGDSSDRDHDRGRGRDRDRDRGPREHRSREGRSESAPRESGGATATAEPPAAAPAPSEPAPPAQPEPPAEPAAE